MKVKNSHQENIIMELAAWVLIVAVVLLSIMAFS